MRADDLYIPFVEVRLIRWRLCRLAQFDWNPCMTNVQPSIDLDRLRHIIGSLGEGVILVDANQAIIWANEAGASDARCR